MVGNKKHNHPPSRNAASLLGLVAVARETKFFTGFSETKTLKMIGRGKETLADI